MLNKFLCGAAIVALSGQAVLASNVIINGVPHQGGNVINLGHGAGAAGCCAVEDLSLTSLPVIHQPAAVSTVHTTAAPAAVTYQSAPAVTYQSAPAVTYQSAPAVTYQSAPVVTHQAAPPVSTHEIIVNQIPAPTPAVAAPVVAAPVIAAPAVIAPQVSANDWSSRVYVGARGGLAFQRDTDFVADRVKVETEYDDPAYSISAVAGWAAKVNNNIQYRLEAEIGYQFADVDSFSSPGATSTSASGDAETIFAFANAYVDVPIIDRLSGTVGGGLGVGRVDFDDLEFSGGTLLDDDDTAFGYHLDAGLTYDITDQIAVEALYRYTSFVDVEVTAVDGTTTEDNLDSHSVLVGARYGF